MLENRKHATSSKEKMSRSRKGMRMGSDNPQYGKRGTASACFKRGSVFIWTGAKAAWKFQWRENGKRKSKGFGIKKYGEEEAKRLAEEYRNKIYPIE